MAHPRAEIQIVIRPPAAPDRLHLVGRVQQIIGKMSTYRRRKPVPSGLEDLFFGNDLSFAPKRTGLPPAILAADSPCNGSTVYNLSSVRLY